MSEHMLNWSTPANLAKIEVAITEVSGGRYTLKEISQKSGVTITQLKRGITIRRAYNWLPKKGSLFEAIKIFSLGSALDVAAKEAGISNLELSKELDGKLIS